MDDIIAGVRTVVAAQFPEIDTDSASLIFRAYGRDGVMGELEANRDHPPHEVGLVIEAVAESQENADAICSFARSSLLHYGYEGRKSTAGNLAFPYSPSDFKAGAVYEFSVYHLMRVADPATEFPHHPGATGRDEMTRLADVADVIRSKNAGPYELTLDIIFAERFWFEEALVQAHQRPEDREALRHCRVGCSEHRLLPACPCHQGDVAAASGIGRCRRYGRLWRAAACPF